MTEERLSQFRDWISTWPSAKIDEPALTAAVEANLCLYVRMRKLAEESSAKSIRTNLRNALRASERLVARIYALDGNSLKITRDLTRGKSIRHAVLESHETIKRALAYANTTFPHRGRRPEHERDMLAAQLAEALKTHSSATPSAARGGIFEDLLGVAFALLGKEYEDLHTLAERVTERELITRQDQAVVEVVPYELAEKKRR